MMEAARCSVPPPPFVLRHAVPVRSDNAPITGTHDLSHHQIDWRVMVYAAPNVTVDKPVPPTVTEYVTV